MSESLRHLQGCCYHDMIQFPFPMHSWQTPTYWQAKLFPLNTFCRVRYSITKSHTAGLAATAFHNKKWRCVQMQQPVAPSNFANFLVLLFLLLKHILLYLWQKNINIREGSTKIGLSAVAHETITAHNIFWPLQPDQPDPTPSQVVRPPLEEGEESWDKSYANLAWTWGYSTTLPTSG